MNKKNKIKVIVLAAGYGKRMQSELPKLLIPLDGKPLISHVLGTIALSGIDEKPVVVVGQQRELVMKTLGDNYEYVVQEEQKGTGHAVMVTEKILKNNADHIVVLYGDHPFISAETIKNLVGKHLSSNGTITMAVVNLPDFDDWRSVFYTNFGRVIRNKDGEILKITEFKDTVNDEEKEIKEVNPSYFCFEAKWLWREIKNLNTNNAQKEYYLTDLVKLAMQEKINIESINIDPREALGVNSKEELKMLEKITSRETSNS